MAERLNLLDGARAGFSEITFQSCGSPDSRDSEMRMACDRPRRKVIRDLNVLLKDPSFSTYRENLLESIFVSELVQAAWSMGLPPVELSRAFVDFQGYDLIATCGSFTRHIQLKALRTPRITLHRALEEKPSACCVLLKPDVNEVGRIVMRYRYFGERPGQPLVFPVDARPAKRTRPAVREGEVVKLERINHLVVPRSAFRPNVDVAIETLIPLLFEPV